MPRSKDPPIPQPYETPRKSSTTQESKSLLLQTQLSLLCNNFHRAISSSTQAIKLCMEDTSPEPILLARCQYWAGMAHHRAKKYQDALEYFSAASVPLARIAAPWTPGTPYLQTPGLYEASRVEKMLKRAERDGRLTPATGAFAKTPGTARPLLLPPRSAVHPLSAGLRHISHESLEAELSSMDEEDETGEYEIISETSDDEGKGSPNLTESADAMPLATRLREDTLPLRVRGHTSNVDSISSTGSDLATRRGRKLNELAVMRSPSHLRSAVTVQSPAIGTSPRDIMSGIYRTVLEAQETPGPPDGPSGGVLDYDEEAALGTSPDVSPLSARSPGSARHGRSPSAMFASMMRLEQPEVQMDEEAQVSQAGLENPKQKKGWFSWW